MLTLAINTASSFTSIALLGSQKLLSENSWKSENDEAEKLMPAIDTLLKEHDKTYKDIERVISIKGPGSFTGLRVGITVANTISYLTGCELLAIDTFKYWWSKESDPETALLIFAGKKGVYVSFPEEAPETINLDELNDYLSSKNIKKAFGDISDKQKEVLDIPFEESAESFGEIIAKIPSEKFTKESIIKPNYIKPPSITISTKKLTD